MKCKKYMYEIILLKVKQMRKYRGDEYKLMKLTINIITVIILSKLTYFAGDSFLEAFARKKLQANNRLCIGDLNINKLFVFCMYTCI